MSQPSSRETGTLTRAQVVMLGLVSTIGPVSTDMYLPAFPQLERDLHHGAGSAQLTLSAWFLGLAIGQFCLGPLADRFGRHKPVLLGLLLYGVATVILATTTSYWAFCSLRFLTALGGAITSVIPRAMVRDVAVGREAVKIMSQLTLVFGVGPILAPLLGSLCLAFGNWRLIFWSGAIAAFLMAFFWWIVVPETLPVEKRHAVSPFAIFARYVTLLREPVFISSALMASFSSFVMFAYLSGAPFLFEHLLGFSPRAFAIFFGLNSAGYILATQLNAKLCYHMPFVKVMQGGMFAVLASALGLLALSLSPFVGPSLPWPLCALIISTTFMLGFIGPNATVLALTHHGHQAGAASALMGTLLFSLGGLSSVFMSFLPASHYSSIAIGMLVGTGGMIVVNGWRIRVSRRETSRVIP